MDEKITVIIADDNRFQVLGLVDLLDYSDQVEVVGQANTAQEAVSLTQNLQPDVIMLDMAWYKNQQEGLHAIRQIRERTPRTGILAMTAYDEILEKALQAGADRAIHKDYLSSKHAMEEHIKATHEARRLPIVVQSPFEKLTRREVEVLAKMCEGLTDKEIAVSLGVTPSTIKKFNGNIYKKLGAKGRSEAISIA